MATPELLTCTVLKVASSQNSIQWKMSPSVRDSPVHASVVIETFISITTLTM